GGEAVALTDLPQGAGEPLWSPDSKTLAFASGMNEKDIKKWRAKAEPPESSKPADKQGEDKEGAQEAEEEDESDMPALDRATDGRRFGFEAVANMQPERSYNQPDLFVAELAPDARARNLTAGYDADVLSGLGSDQHPPRGGGGAPVVWSRDGRSMIAVVAERGR